MSITSEEIEKWAKENPTRAVEFGRLLFKVYMGQAAPDTKFGRQPEDNYADWARAKRALGADTAGIRWVFVSVDPTRDTPGNAHRYATQFDPAFDGTAVSEAELAPMLKDWGIAAYPEGDPRSPDYTVAHPAHSFVVDRTGRLRLMIPPGVRGEQIADDLRRLR